MAFERVEKKLRKPGPEGIDQVAYSHRLEGNIAFRAEVGGFKGIVHFVVAH